jgi:hypothetical protein
LGGERYKIGAWGAIINKNKRQKKKRGRRRKRGELLGVAESGDHRSFV